MKTKIFALSALLGLPVLAVGCSDMNTGDFTYVTYDAAGSLDGGTTLTPVPPFLGQQLDRVGRPGISRLLVNPFNVTPGVTLDQYNAASDSKNAFPTFAANIAINLAVWDGINNPPLSTAGGGCGDQVMAAATVSATRYMALATILANDYLTVDSTQRDCSKNYFALELGIGGYCGGREPKVDVVDSTLNLLQGGTLTTATPAGMTNPLTDGVGSDPDGNPVANFPFLLPPT
jgi:hypothetical protein